MPRWAGEKAKTGAIKICPGADTGSSATLTQKDVAGQQHPPAAVPRPSLPAGMEGLLLACSGPVVGFQYPV